MTESSRVRTSIVGVVVVALFCALLARLWYLQVASADAYSTTAQMNAVRTVQEPPERGRIVDRQGRVLIDNRVANVITVDRKLVGAERSLVVGRLAELLGVELAEMQKRVDDPRYSPYTPVPVVIDVPFETVAYIREHTEDFPFVDAVSVPMRQYSSGTTMAHVLGYTGQINDDELKARKGRGYALGDIVGKGGAEHAYEVDLRGTPGVERLEVDARGRVVRTIESQAPVMGNDVRLTLDLDVQKLAEESLQQGIESIRKLQNRSHKETFETYNAPAGAVVVLDARDGSVVAMASNPTYDPSKFLNGIPTPLWDKLRDPSENKPLNNRAIAGAYAPASTFKIFTAQAMFEAGIRGANDWFNDPGYFDFAQQRWNNAGGAANGAVQLSKALTVSSDAYFYSVGGELWSRAYRKDPTGNALQDVARAYGFGKTTGSVLTGEVAGQVPDEQFKKDFNAKNNADPKSRAENSVWLPGDSINMAIGQGDVLVTPLQLASAYAAFANGGNLYKPRIADAVLDANGNVVRTIEPVVSGQTGLDRGEREAILPGLVQVPKTGTAAPAFVGWDFNNYPIAGKTGTAEVKGKQNTSIYVGFQQNGSPDRPQYVVVALVEEGGYGSMVAAPIVRRVMAGLTGQATPPVVAFQVQGND